MLQQFRSTIGVAIARGNANQKLGRLHYVIPTAGEAKATANAIHSRVRDPNPNPNPNPGRGKQTKVSILIN